jgi:hypothetical protein
VEQAQKISIEEMKFLYGIEGVNYAMAEGEDVK